MTCKINNNKIITIFADEKQLQNVAIQLINCGLKKSVERN